MIFIDKVMSVWPAYMAAPAINGRPIATIGSSTPNLGGNFWVQTLTPTPTCCSRRSRSSSSSSPGTPGTHARACSR
ncbi:hypothetical protein NKG05_23370 [Oerskovia sp. M15]